MDNNKILCIGDSLCLPGHLNKYEDTWPYLLKQEYRNRDFITYFKRQLTTDILNTMGGGFEGPDKHPTGADCLEFYMPEIVILQLGIVDCAPRLLFKLENKVVSRLPSFLSGNYISIIKKLRKRKTDNTLISEQQFKKNLENYIERAEKISVRKIIGIAISFPDKKMTGKNPGIVKNVDLYNSIYLELASKYKIFNVINPLDSRNYEYEIFQDGYHPNKIGHQLIKNELRRIVDEK